jgi:hypothetical protein
MLLASPGIIISRPHTNIAAEQQRWIITGYTTSPLGFPESEGSFWGKKLPPITLGGNFYA